MKIEKQFVRTYKACRIKIFISKYIYIYVHVMSHRDICKLKCDIEKGILEKRKVYTVVKREMVHIYQ